MSVAPLTTEEYELTPEAYRRAFLRDSIRRLKWYVRIFGALIVLVLIAIATLSVVPSKTDLVANLIRLWAPLVAFVVAWPLVATFSPVWISSWYRVRHGRFGVQRCALAEGLLRIERSTGPPSEIALNQRVRYSESLDHCLVFSHPWSPEIVPISAFRSSDDYAEFRARVLKAAA